MRYPLSSPLRILLALAIAIAFLLLWANPVSQGRDSLCDVERFLAQSQNLVTVTADRASVKPWRGRHQVFGIFTIPKALPKKTSILLKVQGVGVYCSRVLHYGPAYEDLQAPIGEMIMLDHIRTRTALRALITGKLDQLRNPNNWQLVYRSQDVRSQ